MQRRWHTVQDDNILLKSILLKPENNNQVVQFVGEYNSTYYKNQFKLADMDIRTQFEAVDEAEDLDAFTLDKPVLVMYPNKAQKDGVLVQGTLLVEFQVIVNTHPQGALKIAGYISLLQALCDPNREKWIWLPYGLAPRSTRESSVMSGKKIHEKLDTRLLMKSLLVTFDLIKGDN